MEHGELPVDEDEVQILLVDLGELAFGVAVGSLDHEVEHATPCRQLCGCRHEPIAVPRRDDALAQGSRCDLLLCRGSGAEHGAGTDADSEHCGDDDAEGGQSLHSVHDTTS